ncbi:hypothetical protein SLA2020_042160 [Shorea laevis]
MASLGDGMTGVRPPLLPPGFLRHKSSSCSLSLLKFGKKWLSEFRQRWPHVFIQRYHREYQRWRPALRGDSKSTCASSASKYSMNATQPQTGCPSAAPPQTADPSFGGFRPNHFPPPT